MRSTLTSDPRKLPNFINFWFPFPQLDASRADNNSLLSKSKTANTQEDDESSARLQAQRILKQQLQERDQQIQQLTLSHRLTQQQQIILENKLRVAQADAQTAQTAVAASSAALLQAMDVASATATEFAQTRIQLGAMTAELSHVRVLSTDAVAARLLAVKLAAERLHSCSAAESACSSAELRIQALEKEQAKSRHSAASAAADAESLRSKFGKSQGSLWSVQGELTGVRSELREAVNKLAGLESDLATGRRSSSEAHTVTVSQTKHLEGQLAESSEANDGLRVQLVELRAQLVGLQSQLVELQASMEVSRGGQETADMVARALQQQLEGIKRAGEEAAAEMAGKVQEARNAMER